jgi:hypothetical protein
MSTPVTEERDPLESFDSVPAVSFDPSKPGGIAEGVWATMTVRDYIKLVQSKDTEGKAEFYEDSGKPVMKAVLPVTLNGEDRNLWAKNNNVPGGLMRALRDAQKNLGSRISPGTEIAVRWTWDTSKPKKLGNHPKAYEVTAKAGATPPPASDPLAANNNPAPGGSSDPWSVRPAADAPPF